MNKLIKLWTNLTSETAIRSPPLQVKLKLKQKRTQLDTCKVNDDLNCPSIMHYESLAARCSKHYILRD